MALRDQPWVIKRTANGVFIPRNRIKPPSENRWGNVRPEQDFNNKDTVAQRANSLILEGQLHAVTGYLSDDGECFEATDGEIRCRAWDYAKEVLEVDLDEKLGGVYCESGKRLPSDPVEAQKYVVSFQVCCGSNSVPLSFPAKAKAAKKLKDLGEKVSVIATKFNCSDQYVRDLLKYEEEVDEDIKDAVNKGTISPTAATKTARARKETKDEVKEKLERGERVKGSDLSEMPKMLTEHELSNQIKIAEKRWREAGSEKDRSAWAGMVKGLKIAAGLEEKL